MADTKAIKTKLKTVQNIGKITKAMEMVARSKMKRAIDRALAVRPFAYFGLEFLVNFSYHTTYHKEVKNYLFERAPGTRTLIVEIASNKGLCGGYNGNMFRELRKYIKNNNLTEVDFIAIGKYAVSHARILSGNLLHSFTSFNENISLSEVEGAVEIIKKEYQTGKYGSVLIAFTNFISTLSQKPMVYELLPLSPNMFKNELAESGDEENRIPQSQMHVERDWTNFVVEPSEDAILDAVIPKLVLTQVYEAVLDAAASEHAARMVAMKNATENADSMGQNLMLSYNHSRQEGITRELSEIAAGSA